MPTFEVVYDSEERGVRYRTLEEAVENAYTGMEVWQLADDEIGTRMCCVWPEPAAESSDDLTARRTARFVRENVGRAEREATAILAEHNPVAPDKVHAIVSLAWGRGFVAGFGAGHESFVAMLDVIVGGEHK